MARKTVFVSDISGEPLDITQAAHVTITSNGDRWTLDVKRSEVETLIQVGRKSKTPGRKKSKVVPINA